METFNSVKNSECSGCVATSRWRSLNQGIKLTSLSFDIFSWERKNSMRYFLIEKEVLLTFDALYMVRHSFEIRHELNSDQASLLQLVLIISNHLCVDELHMV